MVMVSKWNKDGTLIASAGDDKIVKVWSPFHRTDQRVKTLNQEDTVIDLDW
jgi:WD40 repeat protein